MKNYKFKIYKRYKDEIWGKLVLSPTFSYNKRAVLLNYKSKIISGNFRLVSKYNYYHKGFLKKLKSFIFLFKMVRKKSRLLNFQLRQIIFFVKPKHKKKKFLFKHYRSRYKRRFNKKFGLFNAFSKSIYKYSLKSSFKKNTSGILLINSIALKGLRKNRFILLKSTTLSIQNLYVENFFFAKTGRGGLIFRKGSSFLVKNNLKFLLKKKLNLRTSKSFFYAIHVSSPKKKQKKWSLYGLRSIYYRKISLFFGFTKVSSFLKLWSNFLGWKNQSELGSLALLEGRLESFLTRTNLFSSIYFVKKFIEFGNVFVNNRTITLPQFTLSSGEIVSFNKKYFKLLYCTLKRRLKNKNVLLNVPPFIEMDYKLLVGMLIRSPSSLNLTKPVSFDLYTKYLTFYR